MKQFDISITIPETYKVKINAPTFEEAEKYIREQYNKGINVRVFKYEAATEGPMTITQNGEVELVPKAYKVRIARERENQVTIEASSAKKAIEKALVLEMAMPDDDFDECDPRVEIVDVIYEKPSISGVVKE